MNFNISLTRAIRASLTVVAVVAFSVVSASGVRADAASAPAVGTLIVHPMNNGAQGAGYVAGSGHSLRGRDSSSTARFCFNTTCVKTQRCYSNKGAMTGSCVQ